MEIGNMPDDNQYDNTNQGVGFKPFEDQKLILQGKFDVNGELKNFAYHTAVSKDGSKRIDVYEKVGAIFPNDKGDNPKRPDYTGSMECRGNDKLRLAAWKRTNEAGLNYMTLECSEPRTPDSSNDDEPSVDTEEKILDGDDPDEIPF